MIEEKLRLVKGKQTLETLEEILHLEKRSVYNFLVQLRKKGYVQTVRGSNGKRMYTISTKRFPQGEGMFTLINKYSKMKLAPPFVHIVHGKYGPEEALIDAIESKKFRVLQASLWLFNHITKWKLLHHLAQKKNSETTICALYDLTRLVLRTRRMPLTMYNNALKKRSKQKILLFPHLHTNDPRVIAIEQKWNVSLPFARADLEDMQ